MSDHACFDAFEIGNHEFDDGDLVLADFITSLQNRTTTTTACAEETKVLCSNLVPGPTSPLKPLQEDGMIQPSFIKTYSSIQGGNNFRIGVVGVNIQNDTMQSARPSKGTVLTDERKAVAKEVTKLQNLGIDKIILLSHVGYQYDSKWWVDNDDDDDDDSAILSGIDVVVGGHSHTLLGQDPSLDLIALKKYRNAAPLDGNTTDQDAPYATIVHRAIDGSKVCIVQAFEFSKVLGKLDVTFDDKGNVLSCTGRSIFPFDGKTFTVMDDYGTNNTTPYPLSKKDAYIAKRNLIHLGNDNNNTTTQQPYNKQHFVPIKPDTATKASISSYSDQINTLKRSILATVPAPGICYEAFPGLGWSYLCTSPNQTLPHGGGLPNLVAKSILMTMRSSSGTTTTTTPEISIINSGVVRSDVYPGEFSLYQAHELLPFSNTLVLVNMTGLDIVKVLNDAVYFGLEENIPNSYPYASGLRYSVDTEREGRYDIVHDVQVNPRFITQDENEEGGEGVSWQDIRMERIYTVVTTGYLAQGGNGYITFPNAAVAASHHDHHYEDTFRDMTEVFIEYVKKEGVLRDLPLDQYSTKEFSGRGPFQGWKKGGGGVRTTVEIGG